MISKYKLIQFLRNFRKELNVFNFISLLVLSTLVTTTAFAAKGKSKKGRLHRDIIQFGIHLVYFHGDEDDESDDTFENGNSTDGQLSNYGSNSYRPSLQIDHLESFNQWYQWISQHLQHEAKKNPEHQIHFEEIRLGDSGFHNLFIDTLLVNAQFQAKLEISPLEADDVEALKALLDTRLLKLTNIIGYKLQALKDKTPAATEQYILSFKSQLEQNIDEPSIAISEYECQRVYERLINRTSE